MSGTSYAKYSGAGGGGGSSLTIGSPANGLSYVAGVLSLALSSTSTTGALSNTDWNTFNNKQPAGSYALTDLSNLANPTAINRTLTPATDNTISLGSTASSWSNLQAWGLNLYDTTSRWSGAGKSVEYLRLQVSDSSPFTLPSGTSAICAMHNFVLPTAALSSTVLALATRSGNSANPTGSIRLETGNNAGAGVSGDIILQVGTSAGTQGNIKLLSTQGITSGQIATPANPAATFNKLYFKSDNFLYTLNSAGTEAQVLTGSPTFQFFASDPITTASSDITGTSFTTFDNSPTFTFMPTVSGTYKIYGSIPLLQGTGGVQSFCKIINSFGGASLLYESQGLIFPAILSSVFTQSVYTLTGGINYIFEIQGKNSSAGTLSIDAASSSFYLFAELCG